MRTGVDIVIVGRNSKARVTSVSPKEGRIYYAHPRRYRSVPCPMHLCGNPGCRMGDG